jgi:hypothetical protein
MTILEFSRQERFGHLPGDKKRLPTVAKNPQFPSDCHTLNPIESQ